MTKAERAPQLALRGLQAEILTAALPRVAHVLKPYPDNVLADDLAAAIEALRKKGYVHGNQMQPNLTAAGVAAARALAAKA
ncbi:MAG: hypothetical protein J0H79_13980 [Alphaproteobacteria bacterium]|nr:hypothetical protein [Alphaproteobacteria bacterium]